MTHYYLQYNNSHDQWYVVETGKRDIKRVGEIVSWGGTKILPADWWTTIQARMINGTSKYITSVLEICRVTFIQ